LQKGSTALQNYGASNTAINAKSNPKKEKTKSKSGCISW
jgi:hypothetical protein